MSSSLTADPLAVGFVGMGEARVVQKTGRLMAVLGSCVGVTLYHPRRHLGILGHVVLPRVPGRGHPPAKYADRAIPWMVQTLTEQGAVPGEIVAKLVGGACMFNPQNPMQIGEANISEICRALEHLGIPVVARDVGGTSGRRMCFDVASGEIAVESMDATLKVI